MKDGQRMQFSHEFSETGLPQGVLVTSVVVAEVNLPDPPDFTRTLIEPRGPIVVTISDEEKSNSKKIIIKSDMANYQPSKNIRGARGRLYSKGETIFAIVVKAQDKDIYLLPTK